MDPVVILAHREVTVAPGATATVTVRVKNLGRRVTAYDLEVLGEAAAWATPVDREITVRPRGGEAETTISFHPPPGSAVETGEVPFAVRATSKVDDGRGTAEGVVCVSAAASLGVVVAPEGVGRWSASYPITIANTGNDAVRIVIVAHDPKGAVELSVAEPVHDLAVGAEVSTTVKARARKPQLKGTPTQHQLSVETADHPFGASIPPAGTSVASPDDPLFHLRTITFQQKPILTRPMIVLLALLPLLLVVLVASRFFLGEDHEPGLATPLPVSSVEVEPTATQLLVRWAPVSGVIGFQVIVDGGAPQPVEGANSLNFTVDGLEPETEHTVQVQSIGPDEAGNSALTEPVTVTTSARPALPAPTDLAVSGSTLSWVFPAPDGIDAADVEFAVYVDGQAGPTVGAGVMTAELDLEPGTHQVTVRARLDDLESDFAAAVTVEVADSGEDDGEGGAGAESADGAGSSGDDGGDGSTEGGGDDVQPAGDIGLVALLRYVPTAPEGQTARPAEVAEDVGRLLRDVAVAFFPVDRNAVQVFDSSGQPQDTPGGDGGWFVYAVDDAWQGVDEVVAFCDQAVDDELIQFCLPAEVTSG